MNSKKNNMLKVTVDVVKKNNKNLNFTLLEVGAAKIHQDKEPFYELLVTFHPLKLLDLS